MATPIMPGASGQPKPAAVSPMPQVGAEWHWEQGAKYATEGMKALLAINGGAAVALLAFAGAIGKGGSNPAEVASALGTSLFSFGVGALVCVLGFATAYLTQLYYGKHGEDDVRAHRWHTATYVLLLAGVVAFLIGLWFASDAIVLSLTPAAKSS